MKNEVFSPRYETRLMISVIPVTILIVASPILVLAFSITDMFFELIILELFLIALVLFFPLIVLRKIEFKDKVIVKRYVYQDYEFSYSDIISYDLSAIRIKDKRPILLYSMKNSKELLNLINNFKIEHSGRKLDIDINNVTIQVNSNIAAVYSAIISFVISLIVFISGIVPYKWNPKIVSFAIWIAAYAIIYFIIKLTNK